MANNDTAMTRFLFAILQQKCLKDVDWNKVAHDPILTTPITNGHAARMRYSRFRSQILGHEPKARNRNGVSKARLSKKKKDDAAAAAAAATDAATKADTGIASKQPKEEANRTDNNSNTRDANVDTNPSIKSERRSISMPLVNNQPAAPAPMAMIKTEQFERDHRNSQSLPTPSPSTNIKQERLPTGSLHSSLPGTPTILNPTPFNISPTPAYSDLHSQQQRMHIRLLTPSSDSDVMNVTAAASQFSPAGGEMLQQHHQNDTNLGGHGGFNQYDTTGNPQWGHHHPQQHHSPVSVFSNGFGAGQIGYGGLESYTTNPGFGDHQHQPDFGLGIGGHAQQQHHQMFEQQHARQNVSMGMDLDPNQRGRSLPPLQTKVDVVSTQWNVDRFII